MELLIEENNEKDQIISEALNLKKIAEDLNDKL